MSNKIDSENAQNSTKNENSAYNKMFITHKVKGKTKRKDNKRRENFWSVFSFLMSYLSQQFKIKLNLDFHRQFEAVYGCNIEIMKKILSLKIYEIISLFKSNQKDKTISLLEEKSKLDENFEFFMNCTYEQLLDYYFNYSEKNEKQKENNNNINDIDNYFSSFFQSIKKDKDEIKNIKNTIEEIKSKEGKKRRKKLIFLIYKSFKDIYIEFDSKTDIVHTIHNLRKIRLTDYTSKEAFSTFNNPNNDINLNINMNQFTNNENQTQNDLSLSFNNPNQFNMSPFPFDEQYCKDEFLLEEVFKIKSNTPYNTLNYP